MNQLSSHEDPQHETRTPNVAVRPRVSRLHSGTTSIRLRRAVSSTGGQTQEETQLQQRMDAAIQRDLQNKQEGVTAQIAALMLKTDGTLLLNELADILSQEPDSEAVIGFLTGIDDQELEPEELLEALAQIAVSNDVVSAVVPVVAAISLQSLAPFQSEHSVDDLADLVESLTEASADMAEVHGPQAFAVMPRIVSVIQHHAERSRLEPTELPSAIRRITRQVATSESVVQRLLRQTPMREADHHPSRISLQGATADSGHRIQRLVIDRPAEITIRYLN